MDAYLYIKALHLVAVVSWFAGLLYIVRLFIYHVEAEGRPEPERSLLQSQFALMERRLWYGITCPAAIAAAGFGLYMMVRIRAWEAGWFQLKLVLLALLIGYHLYCGRIRKDLAAGRCRLSSVSLRIWNEVATLLLFAIVFTAVLKSPWAAGKAMGWVVVVAGIGTWIMVMVRKRRRASEASRRASGVGRRAQEP
ncbi:MAG: protoporphyrinogen oxidase [Fibrobacteres bacterium]|nr:protoporphyrinogen oxidase [Fibrobacterota bacterium]